MAIRFDDQVFWGPAGLRGWQPPSCAGVLALLMQDYRWQPRPYRVLAFREAGNLAERGLLESHAQLPEWIRVAGGEDRLAVAWCPLWLSSRKERLALCERLAREYGTVRTSATAGRSQHRWAHTWGLRRALRAAAASIATRPDNSAA